MVGGWYPRMRPTAAAAPSQQPPQRESPRTRLPLLSLDWVWRGMSLDSWEGVDKLPACLQRSLLHFRAGRVGQDDHVGQLLLCRPPHSFNYFCFLHFPNCFPPWIPYPVLHKVPRPVSTEESSSSTFFPELSWYSVRHTSHSTAHPPPAVWSPPVNHKGTSAHPTLA